MSLLHDHPYGHGDHGHHDHDGCGHEPMPVLDRPAAVRRAVLLNRLSLGYNTVEAVVALTAGLMAGSIGLLGFGLDSVIEVSASVTLAWRLRAERRDGCTQGADRRAVRLVAASFAALALYVGFESVRALSTGERPEVSVVGIVLTAVSVVVMPVLARAKRSLAPVLGSRAQQAEAAQTSLCAVLSAVVLIGLGANAVLGWWWADPLAALGVAVLAAVEAGRTWRAESLTDTCCA